MYKQQVPYSQALAWQKSRVEEKKALIEKNDHCPDSLFIFSIVLCIPWELLVQNSSLILISRTNLSTFIKLKVAARLHITVRFRSLEEVILCALAKTFCIKASRLEGLTGIWHGNQKLAAIGTRVDQWITYHGLAVNVNPELTPFRWIIPCGLQGYRVGSIKGLLEEFQTSADCGRADLPDPGDGQPLDITCRSLINEFSKVFQVRINYETMSRLDLQAILSERGTDLVDERGTDLVEGYISKSFVGLK